jgi:transposase
MNKNYHVSLTPDERLILDSICRKGMHKSRKIRRAQVLLKSDAGLTDEEIAQEVNISIPTVERVRKRFCCEGLTSALEEKPRPGSPPKVDLRVKTEVATLACSLPPNGYNHWTCDLLKREADQKCSKKLSRSSIHSILEKHQLKPWKKRCGVFPTLHLNLLKGCTVCLNFMNVPIIL